MYAVASRREELGPGTPAAGFTVVAILAVTFLFHAYWALGGDWGAATAYGSTDLPPRGVVAVVALLIAGAGVVVLGRMGLWLQALSQRVFRLGTWACVAAFTLAGLGNLTAPADSYARDWHVFVIGPLLLVLAGLCALVDRRAQRRSAV